MRWRGQREAFGTRLPRLEAIGSLAAWLGKVTDSLCLVSSSQNGDCLSTCLVVRWCRLKEAEVSHVRSSACRTGSISLCCLGTFPKSVASQLIPESLPLLFPSGPWQELPHWPACRFLPAVCGHLPRVCLATSLFKTLQDTFIHSLSMCLKFFNAPDPGPGTEDTAVNEAARASVLTEPVMWCGIRQR